ncbi:uncharacterized protein B0P05DRAFT_533731 [Gilbertella persicaria]|uniref:uncharacterized protein n=1 Tax=Gilbertella persicaria TaxID=101096 RepID=UPI0022206591|nr:uncharacterized protein B0P05DRAFT_554234 [Gilbertella persicaria]XP_051436749.1 uncharacterized protein B0P05DRAFT_533731 [Gilbertella persicaria]KAI8065412.1 hypothetical protein B0P05DRAFT_554234 [Gilbertella persicaria]KAI8085788.1 hypothetical protein B0P05DRAFT_533731 [Gilbertella persicaria]
MKMLKTQATTKIFLVIESKHATIWDMTSWRLCGFITVLVARHLLKKELPWRMVPL